MEVIFLLFFIADGHQHQHHSCKQHMSVCKWVRLSSLLFSSVFYLIIIKWTTGIIARVFLLCLNSPLQKHFFDWNMHM